MRIRVRRVLAISAIAVVALIVIALLALHTTTVQSRILAWSISELERRFDLTLTADRLDFNLLTRSVRMTNVRLAAIGHHDNPFFMANDVTVKLPWAAYRGRLRFDAIGLDDGRVVITRDANGISNLPPGRGRRDPNLPPRRLDVRALTVRNLDVWYRDYSRDIEILAPGVGTELAYVLGEGARGPFAIPHDLRIRVRQRRVIIKPVKGELTFDGSNVDLAGVGIDTTEGNIVVNGAIERTLDAPTLNLKLDGTVDIARGARWAPPPIHVAGTAALDATMTGAPSQFVMDFRASSANAEIGSERRVRFDATGTLTPNGLTLSRAAIHPATGGRIDASVDLPFSDKAWWVKADYRGLDAATAFRLGEVKPLPFGAALSGTLRLDKASGHAPFRLEIHNSSSPRAERGTAPLAGDVDFFIEGDRWRANQQHTIASTRVAGPIGGVWDRRAASRSTLTGNLSVRTGDVGEAARYAALFGLNTPAIVRDSRGPMDASVRLDGRFTEPRFVGTARSSGVNIPSIGSTAFSANFDASTRALNVTNIDATIGAARMRGDVLADFLSRRLAGALDIEAPSASDLMTAVPQNMRLEGPLKAKATLAGTVDKPDMVADVSGTGLTLGGQPVDSLTARARVVGDGINIESLTLTQGAGVLRATGRYAWNTRTFNIDAQGQELRWRGTIARLGNAQATFSLKMVASGPIDKPVGEGALEFELTGGLAGALIGKGTANVRLNGDTALVTGHIPSLGAFIHGTVVPRQPFAYDAVVVMNRIDLDQLITIAGLQAGHVKGTASLSATASGALSQIVNSRVFVNLQEIDADASGVRVRLASPSRLSWDGTALNIDVLDLSVGRGRLLAAGRLAQSGAAKWESTFIGELGDLVRIGRPFGIPAELAATGPVNINWRSTGGIEQSTATLQLAGGSLGWADFPTVRNLAVDATFDGSMLNVQRLTGDWQGGGIEGTASIPRGVLEARSGAPAGTAKGFAKLRVVGLTEQAFAPWFSRATLSQIGARLSASLDAEITRASLDGVTAQLTFDEANFLIAGVQVQQARPSRLTFNNGVLTADDVVWDAEGSQLALTGTARLVPADKPVLDFAVRGTGDLRILSAFAPTVATGGSAKINVGIGGTPSAPVFSGRIDVFDAEVLIREPRIVISELGGTIALDGRRVLFDNFTGSANGGTVLLDGGFLLDGTRVSGGQLAIGISGAALEYPRGLQSESDAVLTLRPNGDDWTLTGDVRVARSLYAETINIAAFAAARRTRPPALLAERSWADRLRLNLAVVTQEDLRVDNNYGRFEAGAALRVTGSVDEPVVLGRVTLREGGEVYLAGNTFHLSRGSISFTNPNRLEPEVDIEMRTLVSGTDISLTLTGPLEKLQTDVRSSNPAVDSREAMAMLFGGFRGEDAVTLLSSELLGVTGRRIGLDTLRIQRGFDNDEFRADPGLIATETDPSARLTLSKRVRPEVEIILSQSLRESGGLSAVVSYKPRRNVELRAVSRDNLDRYFAIRHELTFGGAARADFAPQEQPEISAVTVSGDPRLPIAEVLEVAELDRGNPFNFHKWQSDIDKMREKYHDLGYYEVRIRGTRQINEAEKTIALDYAIEPGPIAELAIEGHPLEPGLQDDLHEAWRRAIFDRFLIEELESRIRRHLMEEDILGSQVKAAITLATPQRKQVTVTVSAGTPVTTREVAYTGNEAFSAKDLDAVLRDLQLEVDGWLDPARTADALEDYYRSEGYLAVDVSASDPAVAGDKGILPVKIEEGRRFTLEAITFPGVDPSRLPEVERAVNFEVEMPYSAAGLDDARRRIEDFYARRGFNSANIEVKPTPDAENAVVDIAFAITEGPQQILREVSSEGATRTSQDIITRSLRLQYGQPVDLGQWAQARKRLYDTNVFRQVDIEPVPLPPSPEDTAAGVQPVRAVVRLVEYPVWRLRYGVQLNDETLGFETGDGDSRQQNLGVLADLQNQNLFGWAITGGIAARYERDRQSVSLFTSNSSFFGLPVRNSGFIFGSRQKFRFDNQLSAITDRVGLSAEQRWRPLRGAEVFYSYRFERSRTQNLTLTRDDPFFISNVIVSRLNAAMLLDRRDDPFEPARGWFTSVNLEQAIRWLGSDYGNSKLLVQQYYFHQLGRIVLASRAQIGAGFGEEALLFTQRFLSGGATTVRGYGENTLGPRDTFGPRGGDALLVLNQEARFPIRGWFEGVTFVDAGNVFRTRGDVSLRDLKVGYGIGLRLDTPFAMLRLDFGIPASSPMNADGTVEPRRSRWYIGIGHIF